MPVINENDTTTTDEISFGDNDFLAAQVAILIGADLLVLLTDTDGPLHRRPAHRPGRARWCDEVTDFDGARRTLQIGHTTSPLGSGGMRSKVLAAEMATAAGIATVIVHGLAPGALPARAGGRAGGHALPAARARATRASSCG